LQVTKRNVDVVTGYIMSASVTRKHAQSL